MHLQRTCTCTPHPHPHPQPHPHHHSHPHPHPYPHPHPTSAADEIIADPSSLVGSVGVISRGFGYVKAIKKQP